jgi:ABC-type transporter Mla MlaB component
MLRLTVAPDGSAPSTILAEGRLVGEWVDLLEGECRRLQKTAGQVELDIGAVTDVDSRGLVVLRRLRREAVVLRGLSPLMLALLSEESAQ